MKKLAVWMIFFLLPGLAEGAAKGVQLQYEISSSGGEKERRVESQYFLQGDHVRVEVTVPGKKEGNVIVITRDGVKKAFALSPDKNTYIEVPEKFLKKDFVLKQEFDVFQNLLI